MKSFRGVMAGSLIMEAIAVALALPVVANLAGGIGSGTAWAVVAIAVALIVLCGQLKRSWAVNAVLALQVAMIAFFFVVPAVAGVLALAPVAAPRRRPPDGRRPPPQPAVAPPPWPP